MLEHLLALERACHDLREGCTFKIAMNSSTLLYPDQECSSTYLLLSVRATI